MSLFVKWLRDQPVYHKLLEANKSFEGNLLEYSASELSIEAQVEFLRWALARAGYPWLIVETGTNKGLFGYLLAQLLESFTLFTFDVDPRAAKAVEILEQAYPDAFLFEFIAGDTKLTLPEKCPEGALFAWVDGGHDCETAYSDLSVLMSRGVPWIAVDDTRMPTVAAALERALAEFPDYARVVHPWFIYDRPGAVLLEVKADA